MPARKRGLGRGLDALLTGSVEPTREQAESEGTLREVPVGDITPGKFQPRREFDDDALESLTASIRAQGVIQPIVLRESGAGGENRYELIAGERRWRAAQAAGLQTIPAVVRAMDDQVALAVALIENIQREGLNPIDEALALQRLIDECGLTHQQCAESVGRGRASVSNLLRLLDLPDDIQALVTDGKLEMGHARALLGSPDGQIEALAAEVIAKGLSVRQTEALVRAANAKADKPPRKPAKPAELSDHLLNLTRQLGGRVNAKVEVKQASGGKGAVQIKFNSMDELEEILGELT